MTFDPNKTIVARVRRGIIPNWKSRLKDYSTISLGLVTVLGPSMVAAWNLMPLKWQNVVPDAALLWAVGVYTVLGAWGAIGKVLIQGPLPEEKQ